MHANGTCFNFIDNDNKSLNTDISTKRRFQPRYYVSSGIVCAKCRLSGNSIRVRSLGSSYIERSLTTVTRQKEEKKIYLPNPSIWQYQFYLQGMFFSNHLMHE